MRCMYVLVVESVGSRRGFFRSGRARLATMAARCGWYYNGDKCTVMRAAQGRPGEPSNEETTWYARKCRQRRIFGATNPTTSRRRRAILTCEATAKAGKAERADDGDVRDEGFVQSETTGRERGRSDELLLSLLH